MPPKRNDVAASELTDCEGKEQYIYLVLCKRMTKWDVKGTHLETLRVFSR